MRIAYLALGALLLTAHVAVGQEVLRYDWQPNQSFAYKVKIVVELPDKTETFQGETTYKVKAAQGDNRQIVYQGGLNKTTQQKEQERPRGFGPPSFRPPPFPASPFSRNNFRGTEQTTNEITLSPRGEVTLLKGDSQLPYLLGNVSLLPFEPLSTDARKSWEVKTGTSITEKEERTDDRFPRFGRFGGPFGAPGGNQEEQVQAATEVTTYNVAATTGDIVAISKSYELKSPAPKAGEENFTLTGSGTWKFDRKLHVPQSLHMEQKLVMHSNNQQVTIPITIDYERLSDAELAKIQADREKALADLKAKHEANMRAQAEAKRIAEQPLSPEEKQQTLAALTGSDTAAQTAMLAKLAEKSVADPDADIGKAIEALLSHKERPLREAAHKALLKWSTAYKAKGELDQQYASPHGVSSTAKPVTATTPLYVGQIVQLKDNNRWVAADILELTSGGQVKVHPRGWNTPAWDKAVARDQLQLAPEELFQPAKTPGVAGATAALRTWSDVTGTHKIEASYVALADGKVVMKRADGRELKVPLASLSKADQAYAAEMEKAAQAPPNPFEQ